MTARAMGAALACAVVGALVGGCGVQVLGDFDGVPYTPDTTVLAYADRHDLLARGGAVVPVKKNKAAQTLNLLLTSARLDISEDWRTMPAEELLEYKRELATSDGLVLRGVPLADFSQRDTLRATVRDGRVEGDFDLAVGQALPPEDTVADRGLGARITVTIVPQEFEEPDPTGGSLACEVEVKREREAGQRGDVATGTVTLNFSTSLYAERLSDANFGVAQPIVACMQERGPNGAGQCRTADPLPTVDETGPIE